MCSVGGYSGRLTNPASVAGPHPPSTVPKINQRPRKTSTFKSVKDTNFLIQQFSDNVSNYLMLPPKINNNNKSFCLFIPSIPYHNVQIQLALFQLEFLENNTTQLKEVCFNSWQKHSDRHIKNRCWILFEYFSTFGREQKKTERREKCDMQVTIIVTCERMFGIYNISAWTRILMRPDCP